MTSIQSNKRKGILKQGSNGRSYCRQTCALATKLADDVIAEEVPRAVHLIDLEGTMGVKHDGSHHDIVLYPTPSSDPDDLLNWSRGKKLKNSTSLQL
jgi:hypothetical protein